MQWLATRHRGRDGETLERQGIQKIWTNLDQSAMKLFLISQNENVICHTYDSAVVAAESVEDARTIHPGHREIKAGWWTNHSAVSTWAPDLQHVNVMYIGDAADNIKRGVICASFNEI